MCYNRGDAAFYLAISLLSLCEKTMTFQEALAYLFSFTNYEQAPAEAYAAENFDLKRVEALLRAVGDPHLGRLTVHIAGTKGKGSVAAMTDSVLRAAGLRTGMLTSPHLCDFTERIQIDGRQISEQALADLVTQLSPAVEAYHTNARFGRLTTFELVTVLAFLYFRQEGASAQVLEVGLGGRLDATNVLPSPDLTVIAPVSYDHTEILGATLGAIAGEKAGIIKPGCPVVMAPQEDEAARVIAARCYALNAPLLDVAKRYSWERTGHSLDGQRFQVRTSRTGFDLTIPLLGAFQLENAATALAGLDILRGAGVSISREAIASGMAQVHWPGRLQVLERSPLLLVDGAHNGASARRLGEALATDFAHRRVLLVVGTSADKDLGAIAHGLAGVADEVVATRSANPRAADASAIARAFSDQGVHAETAEDVVTALQVAHDRAQPEDLICVTGSLFLVGEVLRQWQPGERQEKTEAYASTNLLGKQSAHPELAEGCAAHGSLRLRSG